MCLCLLTWVKNTPKISVIIEKCILLIQSYQENQHSKSPKRRGNLFQWLPSYSTAIRTSCTKCPQPSSYHLVLFSYWLSSSLWNFIFQSFQEKRETDIPSMDALEDLLLIQREERGLASIFLGENLCPWEWTSHTTHTHTHTQRIKQAHLFGWRCQMLAISCLH